SSSSTTWAGRTSAARVAADWRAVLNDQVSTTLVFSPAQARATRIGSKCLGSVCMGGPWFEAKGDRTVTGCAPAGGDKHFQAGRKPSTGVGGKKIVDKQGQGRVGLRPQSANCALSATVGDSARAARPAADPGAFGGLRIALWDLANGPADCPP